LRDIEHSEKADLSAAMLDSPDAEHRKEVRIASVVST
jgi:hypothetical protein